MIVSKVTGEQRVQGYPRPTVFFDGGCPLCSREIAHYRRLDRDHRLRWVDITREPGVLAQFGLEMEVAMSRFHVLDADGRWQTGAWAFAEVWYQLPRYRWLTRLLRRTRLLPLIDRIYSLFARWRKRGRCAENCWVPREDER